MCKTVDQQVSEFIAEGGTCTLIVDDDVPADQGTLRLFLHSDVPGMVIPTGGPSSPTLVCGGYVIRGHARIAQLLKQRQRATAVAT